MNTAQSLENQTGFDQNWPAELNLGFSGESSGTRMIHCQHIGPLYVQKPFYPEGGDCAHIYLLHPPGGIVSGDRLQVEVSADKNAHILLTTPGAGRFYRARENGGVQAQINQLHASSGSNIEWFPMETIVYDQASAELETHVVLDRDSHFIGWEIACLGLTASDRPFAEGALRQTCTVTLDHSPVFIDRLRLDADKALYSAQCGMQNKPVSGIFLAGPFASNAAKDSQLDAANLLAAMRTIIESLNASHLVAITQVDRLFVGRYLGSSAEQARRLFIALWKILRPALLGRAACKPRIWYT